VRRIWHPLLRRHAGEHLHRRRLGPAVTQHLRRSGVRPLDASRRHGAFVGRADLRHHAGYRHAGILNAGIDLNTKRPRSPDGERSRFCVRAYLPAVALTAKETPAQERTVPTAAPASAPTRTSVPASNRPLMPMTTIMTPMIAPIIMPQATSRPISSEIC